MATLTIRNLDERVKRNLRIRAAENGRSMEEEARRYLEALDLQSRPVKQSMEKGKWVDDIVARMQEVGGVDIVIPDYGYGFEPADFTTDKAKS
jgi:antitoxin FitA